MGGIVRLETEGNAFERGRQQGRICRDRALPWFELTLGRLADAAGVGSAEAMIKARRAEIDRWRRRAEGAEPDVIEECCGIAAGMAVSEPLYFTVAFGAFLPVASACCTTLGFRGPEGRPILGKTDDIHKHELGMNVLEVTSPSRGYRHAQFHFACSVWSVAGMNERGLAMGMNGIPGATRDEPGLFSLMALHTILPACATVAEAIDHVRGLRVNHLGFGLILGDAEGEMALVEKNAAGTAVLPVSGEGGLLHSNHILDHSLAVSSPPQVEPILTNGVRRYERARAILPRLQHAEHGMAAFLADRGPSGAIWQQGEDGLHTDFAIMLLPTQKQFRFWTSATPPPEGGETVSIDELWADQGRRQGVR